jgi:hypothetical protein
MRESRSYGSVGEPVGNYRLYPEGPGGQSSRLPDWFGGLVLLWLSNYREACHGMPNQL